MSIISSRERFVAKVNTRLLNLGIIENSGEYRHLNLSAGSLVVCGHVYNNYYGMGLVTFPLHYYLKEKPLKFKTQGIHLGLSRVTLLGDNLIITRKKKPIYLIENDKDGKAFAKIADEEGVFPQSKEVPAPTKTGTTDWTHSPFHSVAVREA